MAEATNISWCDHTWSPWYGCTQVSMGAHGACVGCYAMFLSQTRQKRVVFGGPGRGEGTRDAKAESGWKEPLKWEREQETEFAFWRDAVDAGMATAEDRPPECFIFPSLCDPFDNHPDLPPLRRRSFGLIRATPHLTWLLLTKRPGNIVKLYNETWEPDADGWDFAPPAWPRNAAIGCTVVTQEEADRDIPKLLAAKAALNPAFAFVSMEPLLGPVDLTCRAPETPRAGWYNWLTGERAYQPVHADHGRGPKIDWVITGGETDQGSHRARPSHPDWFRSLRDQCAAAGVPFHFKQWGEWVEKDQAPPSTEWPDSTADRVMQDGVVMWKVGKRWTGNTLDGQLHDARPPVQTAELAA